MDAIDQIIAIGNDSNQLHNSITMTAIVYFKIHYNCNIIRRNIAIGIAVYDMFNVLTSVTNILIKLSMLVLFLDGLIIVFDGMKLKLDKLTEFKYSYDNTISITIIVNFNSISSTGVTATFCLAATDLMVQVINALTSTITVSIELDANIVSIDQLILNSVVYLSIEAVGYHTQVLRNVCDVFYFVFSFVVFLVFWVFLVFLVFCEFVISYTNKI